jgi:hypothetical protein
MTRQQDANKLAVFYAEARRTVVDAGFAAELDWQATREPAQINESTFLREAAWVILNSGFREAVVRRHFGYISLCFCDWESAATVLANADLCVETAYTAFRNARKMQAIVEVCRSVERTTFATFRVRLMNDALATIGQLGYFGPATTYHLAKNLGFQVAKPDRHLVRMAARFGMADVQQFCAEVAVAAGDSVNVVDVTLWRYAVLTASGQRDLIKTRDIKPSRRKAAPPAAIQS